MTLRNMEIYLAVADCLSMSEAAKRLSISQPSVSGTVSEIEEQYGVRLFERLGRKLYITAAGERLQEYCRRILSLFSAMEEDMNQIDERIPLRLGATVTTGTCVMPVLIRQFQEQYSGCAHKVSVRSAEQIRQMLLCGDLDAAVVEYLPSCQEFCCIPVANDHLVLVAAAQNNPFAGQSSISRQQLSEVPFILQEEGSGTRALIDDNLGGLTLQAQWLCNSDEAVLHAVEQGLGCALLSRFMVEKGLQDGTLVEITVDDVTFGRTISLVWHKGKYLGDSLKQLIAFCGKLRV